jgi:PAS domain-containing protein
MPKKNSNNGFSERLSHLMKEKQLTLAQVASAIGTSAPSVHRWTKGGEIDYGNLRSLADFLEVNWIWLRYGDEAITSAQDNLPEQSPMVDMRRKYLSEIMESEARMKSALKMAQVVCWEWNVLSETLSFSENAIDVFGTDPETFREALLPFERLSLEDLLIQFKENHSYDWDFNLTSDDGKETKWFTSRGTLIKDSMQRPLKVLAISTDITERKKTEQALEFSELMMRNMIEIIPVGLCGSDESGHICMLNPEVRRIWGGEKFVDLKDYGEYKGWRESSGEELGAEGWALARAFKYGEVCEKETVNIESFDGKKKTIVMYAAPLLDAQKNIIGAIEVNQDITEIKEIENRYKSAYQNWTSIFNQEDIGILYLGSDGDIKDTNQKLAAICRGVPADIIDRHMRELFDESTCAQIETLITSAQRNQAQANRLTGQLRLLDQSTSTDNMLDVEMILFSQKHDDETTSIILLITEDFSLPPS